MLTSRWVVGHHVEGEDRACGDGEDFETSSNCKECLESRTIHERVPRVGSPFTCCERWMRNTKKYLSKEAPPKLLLRVFAKLATRDRDCNFSTSFNLEVDPAK
jgi:hypothetical protein